MMIIMGSWHMPSSPSPVNEIFPSHRKVSDDDEINDVHLQTQSRLEIEDPSGPSGPLLFGNGSPQPICRLAAIELKSQDS